MDEIKKTINLINDPRLNTLQVKEGIKIKYQGI